MIAVTEHLPASEAQFRTSIMLDAPIPADEVLRLADLHELAVLDTPPEPRFDRITQAAQRLFGVPTALVSLVDSERQWFKSHSGLCATETPRNISFCGHAIHADRPFVIPDASADERFADNPLVAGELHLRFYAGIPLKSRNGRALGTLCLIDYQPRQMSADDLLLLADLGAWAERELNLQELEAANDRAEVSARQLRVVLDSAADAIIAVDEQLAIHTFNFAAGQMFGRSENEMRGNSLAALLPAAAIDQLRDGIRSLMATHQLHLVLPPGLELVSCDGCSFRADIRLGRTDIKGRSCFTLIIRDVTAQHELDAMKSAFVATVSHELRTPLTSIRGAVRLLATMPEAQHAARERLLDIADQNCTRLSQMVDDILDLEKMAHGQLGMDRKVQQAAPWVRNALLTMQTYAESLGVSLRLDAQATDADTVCRMDNGRITQVMVNLLSNAIKFSPRGSQVLARIERVGSRVRLSVIDQGAGIPDAFRPRIFQRFSQAGARNVRGQSGSGLGLAICKAIVEQHGGHIGFDSTVGAGSTFYIELPHACMETVLPL